MCRENTHARTHTERRGQWLCWSDDKLYWCLSPLLSRSAVRRRGRRGRFLFLRLYFFFCIRWIQSRAHEPGTVFGPSDRPLSLSLSAGTDTGSSRDVTPRGTNERGAKGAVPGFNRPRLLFMRHTYPRATLRVEQRVCFVWQVPTVTDHSVCMQQR